jgi:hypothetical protein
MLAAGAPRPILRSNYGSAAAMLEGWRDSSSDSDTPSGSGDGSDEVRFGFGENLEARAVWRPARAGAAAWAPLRDADARPCAAAARGTEHIALVRLCASHRACRPAR